MPIHNIHTFALIPHPRITVNGNPRWKIKKPRHSEALFIFLIPDQPFTLNATAVFSHFN